MTRRRSSQDTEFRQNYHFIVSSCIIHTKHTFLERAEGIAKKAATIHTLQIVSSVTRHVCFAEKRIWKGFTVTLYRLMLSTATEDADRPTDISSTAKMKELGRKVTVEQRSEYSAWASLEETCN